MYHPPVAYTFAFVRTLRWTVDYGPLFIEQQKFCQQKGVERARKEIDSGQVHLSRGKGEG